MSQGWSPPPTSATSWGPHRGHRCDGEHGARVRTLVPGLPISSEVLREQKEQDEESDGLSKRGIIPFDHT